MNLVNELENDLALAFLVDKQQSDKLDSKEIVALMTRLRDVLQPFSDDEASLNDNVLLDDQSEQPMDH